MAVSGQCRPHTISPVSSASVPPLRKMASSKVRLELPIRATRAPTSISQSNNTGALYSISDLTPWKSMPVFRESAYWSVAERAEILCDRSSTIGQIMRVEHHALTVDFGISHPEGKEEPELLA